MTDDEAFRTLGVGADADAQAVRRVYLELIKLHPPERDPERFKLVREAFECLRAAGPRRAAPVVVAPVPQPIDDASLQLREELMLERDPARRIALARVIVDGDPSQTNYALLIAQFDDFDDAIAGVLREAVARGYTDFAARLRRDFADCLSAEELAAWRTDVVAGRTPDGLALATLLIADQPENAAQVATLALARGFKSQLDAMTAARVGLDVIWSLLESHHVLLAQRVDSALAAVGCDTVAYPDLAVQLEATHELVKLAPGLEQRLIDAIVASLSNQTPERVNVALDEVRDRDRDAHESQRRALEGTRVLSSLLKRHRRTLFTGKALARLLFALLWCGVVLYQQMYGCADSPLTFLFGRRDAITLSCHPDKYGLCRTVDNWNRGRSCGESSLASDVFEEQFRSLLNDRKPTALELRARDQMRERTRRICTTRPGEGP